MARHLGAEHTEIGVDESRIGEVLDAASSMTRPENGVREFHWLTLVRLLENGSLTGGRPVVVLSDADLANLLAPDIVPSWSVEHLQQLQVKLSESALNFNHPLALVLLHNAGGAPTYVAGTDNFFTITRYNRSSYYALAVIELGEAIARAKELGTTTQGECP